IVEIAPLVGRLDILDLCLRVAAAKGQVTAAELQLLKELSEGLQIDRERLRAMVAKILPVEMHQTKDAEMILGVTSDMSKDEARHQLTREYAKWSSRVISTDPAIRRQADQMIRLIADARAEYVTSRPAAEAPSPRHEAQGTFPPRHDPAAADTERQSASARSTQDPTGP
ncbi:MAG: hypothetical protein M1376_18375, partial [Planctomycetes bacterium]|nr:hypothetical protein [Planctomycetota bacterium]